MSCERSWQARAIDEGRLAPADILAFERHARTCATCHEAEAALSELRDLSSDLGRARPGAGPTELDLRRLRARVLRDAMAPRSSGRAFGALAAAIFGLGLILYFARPWLHGGTNEAFAGSVVPSIGAAWTQARLDGVERVVLTEGEVTLHVRKQREGERFLVVVPDGEVEVRGTTFEVAVHARQTSRVHVDDGVVDVRIGSLQRLSAGESWPPPTVKPESGSPVVATPPAPPRAPELEPEPGPTALSDASSRPFPALPPRVATSTNEARVPEATRELADYEAAVAAYRAGAFEQAAEGLHAFSMAYQASPFLDDASFLEASSLANAGRSDAAALLAERHLARFPSSFHRKDAAILVARLRRDRGDCDGARSAVDRWLAGLPPDPRVVAALGGCLPR